MDLHSRDQDLLMLAHEALPLWPRIATQVHVVFCTGCRERLAKMEGASRLIADTIRNDDMRRWRLPTSRGAAQAARTATAWLAAFAILIVLTALMAALTMRGVITRHQAASYAPLNGNPAASSSDGCRPDLPSDQCR